MEIGAHGARAPEADPDEEKSHETTRARRRRAAHALRRLRLPLAAPRRPPRRSRAPHRSATLRRPARASRPLRPRASHRLALPFGPPQTTVILSEAKNPRNRQVSVVPKARSALLPRRERLRRGIRTFDQDDE